jgi:hypothetical protein
MHINHLTNQLTTRARNVVRVVISDVHHYSAGATTITTVEDFAKHVTGRTLFTTPGCGKKSATEIVRMCRDLGFPIKDSVTRMDREWQMWCAANSRMDVVADDTYYGIWAAAWKAAMKARSEASSLKEEQILKQVSVDG